LDTIQTRPFKCIETAVLATEGTDAINNGGIDCDLDSGTEDTTSDETTSDAISETEVDVYRKDYYRRKKILRL
jgi:hypothetical protein